MIDSSSDYFSVQDAEEDVCDKTVDVGIADLTEYFHRVLKQNK